MAGIYEKSRELTIGPSGTTLSVYHLTSHQNIDSEIQDISTALNAIEWVVPTSYTPTWTAATSAPSIGNGSLSGRYIRIGGLVTQWFQLTIGSTTNLGSGAWFFSVPVTAFNTSLGAGSVWANDAGTAAHAGVVVLQDTTKVVLNIDGGVDGWKSTIPFSWVAGDALRAMITYPVA